MTRTLFRWLVIRCLPLLLFSLLSLLFVCALPVARAAELPPPERWLAHIEQDIAPFWLMQEALGEPVGNFPTFRHNDGSSTDDPRQFVRMHSRQVFTYGAIYHMTGSSEAFAAMCAGVDWLLKFGLGPDSSAYLWALEPAQPPEMKTAQDQAYALVGLAMYYYLTRDETVLKAIVAQQQFIFSQYLDSANGLLRWDRQSSNSAGGLWAERIELVAQLDQLNAYLVLLEPILPSEYRAAWQARIAQLVTVLFEYFYDEQEQRFYGVLGSAAARKHHARHGDFGHTAKAFWMAYISAKQLQDVSPYQDDMAFYAELAYDGLLSVFPRAYRASENHTQARWASHVDSQHSAWWEFAELDQAAAFLLLDAQGEDAVKLEQYLVTTYPYWLQHMVDGQHGGIWPGTAGAGGRKVHQWKNGYHATEHALIAYIASAQYLQHSYRLYFAEPSQRLEKSQGRKNPSSITPYLFSAEQGENVEIKLSYQQILVRNFRQVRVNFDQRHK